MIFDLLDREIGKRAIICMLVLGSLRGLESWCKLVLGMMMIIVELDQEDVIWAHLMALAVLTWGVPLPTCFVRVTRACSPKYIISNMRATKGCECSWA